MERNNKLLCDPPMATRSSNCVSVQMEKKEPQQRHKVCSEIVRWNISPLKKRVGRWREKRKIWKWKLDELCRKWRNDVEYIKNFQAWMRECWTLTLFSSTPPSPISSIFISFTCMYVMCLKFPRRCCLFLTSLVSTHIAAISTWANSRFKIGYFSYAKKRISVCSRRMKYFRFT